MSKIEINITGDIRALCMYLAVELTKGMSGRASPIIINSATIKTAEELYRGIRGLGKVEVDEV